MEIGAESTVPEVYGIIIVGVRAAGCILANRLSENSNMRMLMLEASANLHEDLRVKTPVGAGQCLGISGSDWRFWSELQAGLDGRIIYHLRMTDWQKECNQMTHSIIAIRPGLNAWAEFGKSANDEQLVHCDLSDEIKATHFGSPVYHQHRTVLERNS